MGRRRRPRPRLALHPPSHPLLSETRPRGNESSSSSSSSSSAGAPMRGLDWLISLFCATCSRCHPSVVAPFSRNEPHPDVVVQRRRRRGGGRVVARVSVNALAAADRLRAEGRGGDGRSECIRLARPTRRPRNSSRAQPPSSLRSSSAC